MEPELPKPTSPLRRATYQFSLRAMLGLTALVALFCGLLFAAPPVVRWFAAMTLNLVMPMAWTVVLTYRRGCVRTFAIGALFPAGLLLVYIAGRLPDKAIELLRSGPPGSEMDAAVPAGTWPFGAEEVVIATAALGVSLLFGILAVGLRRLVEPR